MYDAGLYNRRFNCYAKGVLLLPGSAFDVAAVVGQPVGKFADLCLSARPEVIRHSSSSSTLAIFKAFALLCAKTSHES